MGCAASSDGATAEQKQRNAQIEEELKKSRSEMRTEVKMLLLGAGESGKSTIVKQMRLVYAEGYTNAERDSYREVVYSNALQSIQAVIRGFDLLSIPIPSDLEHAATYLDGLDSDAADDTTGGLERNIKEAIEALWADAATRSVVDQSMSFQLNDSASYFFDAISRIGQENYVPTDQDILRTRVRSTGITEERFRVKGHTLRVFDVGGQRSERKKWIHCFENVQVLVFVAAISEIGQQLWEDETISRMDEATMLFESISSSRWFEKSAFVLLLNKTDLFREKISRTPLAHYYPEFTGGDSYELACQFMLSKFTSLDKKRAQRPLYSHFTQATDTKQVAVVMAAVMDSVLTALLSEVGLM